MEIKCAKCGKICKNLQGWKQHNSAAHGGYDDAELEAVAGGGASVAPDDTRARMAAFADTLPGTDAPAGSDQRASQTASPEAPPAVEPARRVRATPKKLKKILGGIPTKILEELQVPLDDEDRDALDEAAEFLADVFGFEFSVPESKYVVESRIWAFAWVAGISLLIWLKHNMAKLGKMATETKDDAGNDGAT